MNDFRVRKDMLTSDHPMRQEFDALIQQVLDAIQPLNEVGDFAGAMKTAAAMIVAGATMVGNMARVGIFPDDQLEAWIVGNTMNLRTAAESAAHDYCEECNGRLN